MTKRSLWLRFLLRFVHLCATIVLNSNQEAISLTANRHKALSACRAAFPYTVPVFAGYCFLGMSYGILMKTSGFPVWYPMLTSLVIFAGSMEFVTVNLLLGAFNPLQAVSMALMLNARHLFYGLSMLRKYQDTGWKKVYLLFGLTDETFSVNCAIQPPANIDRSWFYFFVTFLNHCYWVLGATLGGIFGSLLHFNTEGLDFVMTALFVVILLEHMLSDKDKTSAYVGMLLSILALVLFGGDGFMIPAMVMILGALLLLVRKEATA